MDEKVEVMGMISPNWVSQAMGARFSERYFMDPEYRLEENARIADWLAEFDQELAARFCYPGVKWYPIGISGIGGVFDNPQAHIVDIGIPQTFILITAMMGGEIVYFDGDNPDVKGYPLADIESPDEIQIPDLEEAWPVGVFLRQYEAMVEKYGREKVHLFAPIEKGWPLWYLHSPLSVAYRLRGDRLFVDMVEQPALANRILDVALDIGLRLFEIYEEKLRTKILVPPIASCIATLISPRVYEQFEIPRLRKLIDRFGKAKIHSCGPSSHVLHLLGRLPNLVEVELGARTDMALARKLWPEVNLVYLLDTPKFVHQTSDEVRLEVSTVIHEASGGPLVIEWPAETGTPLDTVGAIYETVSEYNQSLVR